MCGIIGTTKTTNHEAFEKATHRIAYRGPDFTGTYTDTDIRLRHVLLAIRGDVKESEQPMHSPTSQWVLAFNGQLYNTKQMRSMLGAYAPHSEVDTHLLYALIEQYGWKFIEHIHGMYAIALYNKTEKIIRLYRDESGQKNLYYVNTSTGFSFCSEIRGLLEVSNIPRTADMFGLSLATTFGYIPGEYTLIKNVYKVQPSEEITYDLHKKSLSRRIFSAPAQNYFGTDTPDLVMSQVIHEHLQGKREIAVNLSGGMDSSLIFYEAVRQGYPVHAFSTQFEACGDGYNTDSILAKKLAEDYNQKFTPITITRKSYLDNFTDAYKIIEEPNYNISIPIYHQTAQTEGIHGEGLRVVMSGDGGDELFGGYAHYAKMQKFARYKKFITAYGLNAYKHWKNNNDIDYRIPTDVFYDFRAFGRSWNLDTPISHQIRSYLKKIYDAHYHYYGLKNDDVYKLMCVDRYFWLTAENFIRSDKLYMHQSMEMRCPLAYTPLRTYMDTRIPSHQYISQDTNKIFLRNLYTDKLPAYIINRKDKTGWRAPVQTWYNHTYKNLFLDILSSAEKSTLPIDWKSIQHHVAQTNVWPGKMVHLYLSIALLSKDMELT